MGKGSLQLTDAESEVCCFLELSERRYSREPRGMLDWRLTGGALPALGASLSAVFLRRRALWRCRRARQLRLSPSKDVRSWKRPHCWQKRWRLPSRMMLLTCQHVPAGQTILLLAMHKLKGCAAALGHAKVARTAWD